MLKIVKLWFEFWFKKIHGQGKWETGPKKVRELKKWCSVTTMFYLSTFKNCLYNNTQSKRHSASSQPKLQAVYQFYKSTLPKNAPWMNWKQLTESRFYVYSKILKIHILLSYHNCTKIHLSSEPNRALTLYKIGMLPSTYACSTQHFITFRAIVEIPFSILYNTALNNFGNYSRICMPILSKGNRRSGNILLTTSFARKQINNFYCS